MKTQRRSPARPLSAAAFLLLAFALPWAVGQVPDLSTPASEGAELYIISPQAGQSVPETFTVRFGLKGMGVAPAGVDMPGTGHHHLLINEPEVDMSLPLPTSDQVVHFGKGQTEATITLPPGKHVLQLLLGNHLHVPHTPPVMSEPIEITVIGGEVSGPAVDF